MTHETDRLSVDDYDLAFTVQHVMGVYLRVFLIGVTFKADLSSLSIRAASQAIHAPSVVRLVTRQASDPAVIEW